MNKRLVVTLLTLALLAGCGNAPKQQEDAGSFAVNSDASTQLESGEVGNFSDAASTNESENDKTVVSIEATKPQSDTVVPEKSQTASLPVEEKKKAAINAEKKQPTETKEPVQQQKQQGLTDKTPVKAPIEVSKEASKEASKESTKEASNAAANESSKDDKKASHEVKNAGISEISWSKFFDNEDQTTPSDQFWDLSGSNVEINGYMGEVLSFENNWFLLIPKPGAECPFDNGDETYWNKIMIVFVPEGTKLRHHTGPLKISGRLDVGIKIDESGYKTMFRLYDASFEEIKE
jgi:hypothetical protein